MSTENPKYNVENLPLTIDGKIEMVPRRQYCNHKAQTLTIKHKTDIKKGPVSDMIDMIVAGKELQEGNEPVWEKVYEEIKEDIELAQDKNAEAITAANQAAEEKKQAEEALVLKEKQLVEAATSTDVTKTFASLGDKFELGSMDRCIPKGDVSDADLMSALVAGMAMENFSNWAKGDLVSELEKRGHENAMQKLCETTGVPYKSIYRMAVTAREVPPDSRKPGVSFTTYAEIANARFSTDEAKNKAKLAEVIAKVGEKKLTGDEKKDATANANIITTSQEARKAVQIAQGKTITAPDPNKVDLEKDSFIIVDTEAGSIQTCTGFPAILAGNDGVVIIHAKTQRKSYDAKGNKWTALDKYTHPAPEPEEKKPAATAAKGNKGAAATPAPAAAAPAAKKGKGGKK